MRKLKLNNWIVAIGLVVALFGLTNAASVVLAISSPAANHEDKGDSSAAGGWSGSLTIEPQSDIPITALDGPVMELQAERLSVPSAAFLAQAANAETPAIYNKANGEMLSELHEAEMLYPQDIAERIANLPAPTSPEIPVRLIIPAIELEAPILPAEAEVISIAKKSYQVWRAPDQYGVGWHVTSAPLGVIGNTVLNGHHNVKGEVFKDLADLNPGDQIIVESESGSHQYVIVNRMILPEKYAPLDDRIANAQWILPSEDERLTLITCWPYESNTHRLILVARPDK
jgi:LPXTG-site transpeptidase (sortase) family protein